MRLSVSGGAVQAIQRSYEVHIVEQGKEPALLVLLAFLLTFITVRILVHRIRAGGSRIGNLKVGALHVHHLVWGILLLLITGFVTIATSPSDGRALALLATAYGVGAALTLDEFALWLHLQDVYWEREGRKSVDAVVITAVLIGMFILGSGFLTGVLREWIALDEGVARIWFLEAGDSEALLALSAAITILTTAGLWLVFDKAGSRGWLALVPVVNLYVLIRMSGKPTWWVVPALVPVAGLVVHVLVMLAIASRFGRGRLFGLALALLPGLFLILLGASRDRYAPATAARAQAAS